MPERVRPRLSPFDIERRADTPQDAMMIGASSASTAYRYALERGWITQAEYDQAREWHGRLWNYCGD